MWPDRNVGEVPTQRRELVANQLWYFRQELLDLGSDFGPRHEVGWARMLVLGIEVHDLDAPHVHAALSQNVRLNGSIGDVLRFPLRGGLHLDERETLRIASQDVHGDEYRVRFKAGLVDRGRAGGERRTRGFNGSPDVPTVESNERTAGETLLGSHPNAMPLLESVLERYVRFQLLSIGLAGLPPQELVALAPGDEA